MRVIFRAGGEEVGRGEFDAFELEALPAEFVCDGRLCRRVEDEHDRYETRQQGDAKFLTRVIRVEVVESPEAGE